MSGRTLDVTVCLGCIDLKKDSQLVGNIPIAGKLYIEELHKKREREENEDKKGGLHGLCKVSISLIPSYSYKHTSKLMI